jgi:CBS domain-containing protein
MNVGKTLIRTLMIPDPPTLNPNDPLAEAIRKVNEFGVGRVIVGKEKVVGLVTTRDLLELIVQECPEGCPENIMKDVLYAPVKNHMVCSPSVAYENDLALDIINVMVSHDYGSMPVVDKAYAPKGIVTEREFLLLYQDLPKTHKVKSFATSRVATIDSGVRLEEAVSLMIRRGFRRLPVVDSEGKVIGIITATDAIKAFAKFIEKKNPSFFFGKKVSEVMKSPVLSISPETYVNDAAKELLDKKKGSFMILDENGKVSGIITERDLLIALHHMLHMQAMKTGE